MFISEQVIIYLLTNLFIIYLIAWPCVPKAKATTYYHPNIPKKVLKEPHAHLSSYHIIINY